MAVIHSHYAFHAPGTGGVPGRGPPRQLHARRQVAEHVPAGADPAHPPPRGRAWRAPARPYNRSVALTQVGREVLPVVERAWGEINAVALNVRDVAGRRRGSVTV